MDLGIKNHRFLICGASSGFGRAIAENLLAEGAFVITVARRGEKLQELKERYKTQVEVVAGDLTEKETHDHIESAVGSDSLEGMVLNSGGPPVLTPLETALPDWDRAYESILRWKVGLTLRLIEYLTAGRYGRILFVESKTVKEPIPKLVLSNSYRAAVVGFAKSLSEEIAVDGVTVNVIAPGSHDTPAIERVIRKESRDSGRSEEEVRAEMEKTIPVGRFGKPEEIASLAVWLLSPHAAYVTGQTFSHDGGAIKGIFG